MAIDVPKLVGGMSFKQLMVATLAVQTSAHVLVLHYSRTMPTPGGQRYFISTAVFLNEILKLTVSLTLALFDAASNPSAVDNSTAASLFMEVGRAVFRGDSWQMAIPAALFTLQSASQYVAIGNMGAATFQVTNQLKVVTTALFGAFFISRTMDSRKWMAFGLLLLGIVFVQIPTKSTQSRVLSVRDLNGGMAFHEARSIWVLKDAGNEAAEKLSKRSATYAGIDDDLAAANPQMNPYVGLVAALIASTLSGFAGNLFEKKIKEPRNDLSASIWVCNVQLSVWSLIPATFIGVVLHDGEGISRASLFTGYNWAVWTAIVLQAAGGILVGLLAKHDGQSCKSLSGAASIVLTFLGSLVLFDHEITPLYLGGAALALGGIYLLEAEPAKTKPRLPPIHISVPEKTDNGGMAYFDLESNQQPAKSPLRPDQISMSTSRPTTPTHERRHFRSGSSDLKMSKRSA